jgi:hypothetical protein
MNEELQKQINDLQRQINDMKRNPEIVDHLHNGFDVSRVRFADLDTVFYKEQTINPGNLADGAGETQTVSGISGANLGDFVMFSAPYSLQGITVTAYVSATDTVSIRIQNESGGAVDLGSGTWRVMVIRKLIY